MKRLTNTNLKNQYGFAKDSIKVMVSIKSNSFLPVLSPQCLFLGSSPFSAWSPICSSDKLVQIGYKLEVGSEILANASFCLGATNTRLITQEEIDLTEKHG